MLKFHVMDMHGHIYLNTHTYYLKHHNYEEAHYDT